MKRIYNILLLWKEESKAGGVLQFKYDHATGKLIIYTSYPGWLIGKAGWLVDKYREILRNEVIGFDNITFIETDYYFVK